MADKELANLLRELAAQSEGASGEAQSDLGRRLRDTDSSTAQELGRKLMAGVRGDEIRKVGAEMIAVADELDESEAPPARRARRKTDIDDMTVPELKDYAAWKKIDLGDATRKEDIKAAIELAINPADDEPEDEPEAPAPVEEDRSTGSWPTFGGSNA